MGRSWQHLVSVVEKKLTRIEQSPKHVLESENARVPLFRSSACRKPSQWIRVGSRFRTRSTRIRRSRRTGRCCPGRRIANELHPILELVGRRLPRERSQIERFDFFVVAPRHSQDRGERPTRNRVGSTV